MASTPNTTRKRAIIRLTSRTCTAWLTNMTSSTLKSWRLDRGAASWPTSRSKERASCGSLTARKAAARRAMSPQNHRVDPPRRVGEDPPELLGRKGEQDEDRQQGNGAREQGESRAQLCHDAAEHPAKD